QVLSGTYDAPAGSDLLMVVHRGVEAEDNIDVIAESLTAAGKGLAEMSRESVRGNTWIHYKVEEREGKEGDAGILGSAEDIALTDKDGSGKNYCFTYGNDLFESEFENETWKIYDSYKISNMDDMKIICGALQAEHPVHIGDTEALRTPEDMAQEWMEHNVGYELFAPDSEWSARAKDVDLDPHDVGKSIFEIYEDRTGKKFNLGDVL
ncbi:MAG: hypothetical protein J6X66_02445, partial [Lachnospiraceae bacterium]|nr:hypothetical protein [Lachnospiraceae bacterium]